MFHNHRVTFSRSSRYKTTQMQRGGLKTVTLRESRNGTGKVQLLTTNNSNMGEKPDKILNNSEAKLWII